MIYLAVEAAMDVNRTRKLNFDAPLLSTKRHVSEERSLDSTSKEIRNRVPFSWEQVPGTPKSLFLRKGDSENSEAETPRLKLPPGRLAVTPLKAGHDHSNVHNHSRNNHDHVDERCSINREAETSRLELPLGRLPSEKPNNDHVDGCHPDDGDKDDGDGDGSDIDALDVFSDAVDVLSLTQAIDIVEHQKPERGKKWESDQSDSNGYLTVESIEHSGNISPSYIIERFLPDAAALAATSELAVSAKKLNKNKFVYLRNHPDKAAYVMRAVGRSLTSPKLCGLQMLIPWRTKHRICGLKSNVSHASQFVYQPKVGQKEQKD